MVQDISPQAMGWGCGGASPPPAPLSCFLLHVARWFLKAGCPSSNPPSSLSRRLTSVGCLIPRNRGLPGGVRMDGCCTLPGAHVGHAGSDQPAWQVPGHPVSSDKPCPSVRGRYLFTEISQVHTFPFCFLGQNPGTLPFYLNVGL